MQPVRRWFGHIGASQLTERDVDLYVKHRLEQGLSTTTVNRELQYLGQSMRLAKRKKLIDDIPLPAGDIQNERW
jgi:site-specific recombinase XerD